MKVKLMRDTAPFGRTGDIVEVSPSAREWLLSLGMAVPVAEARERAEAPEAEKPAEVPKAEKPAVKPAAKKTKSSAKK